MRRNNIKKVTPNIFNTSNLDKTIHTNVDVLPKNLAALIKDVRDNIYTGSGALEVERNYLTPVSKDALLESMWNKIHVRWHNDDTNSLKTVDFNENESFDPHSTIIKNARLLMAQAAVLPADKRPVNDSERSDMLVDYRKSRDNDEISYDDALMYNGNTLSEIVHTMISMTQAKESFKKETYENADIRDDGFRTM